ncbi:CapA family protein [Fundicoccus culcitae]|uniref:CapA family protein n=1 Tax=Fundicoccus culcitae TaxID=2969821 RepID=A0ABY5P6T3_9LACT|nr:CapA family protein [Fundicoccus culcitae]UUX34447.1 CapA family protein [Fundicoccus culcitae]
MVIIKPIFKIKKTLIKFFLFIAAISFTAACGNTSAQMSNESESVASESSDVQITQNQAEEATSETSNQIAMSTTNTITIRSIGDILIHDFVYNDARTADGFDFTYMFEPVRPYLENADITTANLEVLVAGSEYGLSSYPVFNAPAEIIDSLQDVGVDLVSNATNHTMDFGSSGAHQSISNLQERDMMYVGSYADWQDYNNLRIIEENGISVGFLAYADHVNGNYIPEDESYLISLIDSELMPLEIDYMNQQTDFTVVMIHYGEEGQTLPNQNQLVVSSLVRDAGANLIIGTHPHALQPAISYNDQQAGVYSLGNFLSGQIQIEEKLGGIIEFELTKGENETEISKIRYMPTYNFGTPSEGGYLVVPLAAWSEYGIPDGEALFDEISQRIRFYSDKIEVVDYLD